MDKETEIEGYTINGECAICNTETDCIQFVSDVNKKPKHVGWFYMCNNHEYEELKEYVYNAVCMPRCELITKLNR